MKRILFILVMFVGSGVVSATTSEDQMMCESSAIYGKWKWHKYIYEGQEYPLSNPDLHLTFEFSRGGGNRLHWERKGQRGFCERYGNYIFSQCYLIDKVVWVNPKNAMECGSDPDMQIDRQTQGRVEVHGSELYLYVGGGEKTFIYVWKKQN